MHCMTHKGKGYLPAEHDEIDCLHTVGVIDPGTGRARLTGSATWTSVFAEEITAIGAERDDIVCLTAAMLHPTGLGGFATGFPDRVFDVEIAEQHAITSAAGLAIGGLHPVVALYSTFASRAVDQLLMGVALHQLPVTVVLDRAGITGPDGPSHHDPAAVGLLVAVGPLAAPCLAAADELAAHDIPVTVIDPRWIAPLDPALDPALAATGSDICAATFALPPRFLPHGSRDEILRAHGLDAAGIATAVLTRLGSTHRSKSTAKETA